MCTFVNKTGMIPVLVEFKGLWERQETKKESNPYLPSQCSWSERPAPEGVGRRGSQDPEAGMKLHF